MMTMRFRRAQSLANTALLTILLAALLTACGSSANAQPGKGSGGVGAAGATIDACALITKAEAEALLGMPVGEPTPKPINGGITTCTFLPTEARDLRQLFIWTNPRQSADSARKVFDNTKKGADPMGAPTKEEAGFGDSAFWTMNQLWILEGKVVIGLSTDSEDHTRKLAALVLQRLP